MRYVGLITGLSVLLAAVTVGMVQWIRTDKEDPQYVEESAVRREFFSNALQHATSSYDTVADRYVWGRTLMPSYAVQLHSLNFLQRYTQKKEFVWIGLTAGPWLIGFAVLQFNYVSVFTVHFYNAETGESWKAKTTVPLLASLFGGKWVPNEVGNFGPNAAGHRVVFKAPFTSQRAAIAFTDDSVHIEAAGSVSPHMTTNKTTTAQQQEELMFEVSGTASLPKEFLGFVFPLGPRRAALVNKLAAAPLRTPLVLRLGEQKWGGAGFFSMDYTRGLLRRETRWHWASATASGGYGFHLSEGTYDIDKKSVENTFYVSGKALLVDAAVVFQQEAADVTSKSGEKDHDRGNAVGSNIWTITGDGVQLRFRRVGAYDGNFNYGIVKGNLDHGWGIFDGRINVSGVSYSFDNVPGVMEEHYALW